MQDSRISIIYTNTTPCGGVTWLVQFDSGEKVYILRESPNSDYYQWLWASPTWWKENTAQQVWGFRFLRIKTVHNAPIPPAVEKAFEGIINKNS